MVDALSSLKDINTIIIGHIGSGIDLNRCIEATKQKLKDLPVAPSKERRFTFAVGTKALLTSISIDIKLINAYVGYYSEVPM